MNCFFNIPSRPAKIFLFMLLAAGWTAVLTFGQSVDTKLIQEQIEEGELEKAIRNLGHFLGPERFISRDDSLYVLKTLGMAYSSLGKPDSAKWAFKRLLLTDVHATIRNTDASHSIIEVFIQAKNEFKKEHGGEILRPKVVVMDPLGPVGEDRYRHSIARQFIEELQKLYLFEAMSWSDIKNGLKNKNLSQKDCDNEACFIHLGKVLEGDKIILMNFEQVENVVSLTIKYMDVESGKTESIIKNNAVNSMDELILSGLEESAKVLETQNAAWLQFSMEPPNAYLELNGEPTSGDSRIPVMPGKHRACATAAGYKQLCKSFVVRQNDGITHRLALEPDHASRRSIEKGTAPFEPSKKPIQETEDKSVGTELWILGGLAVLGVILAIIFSSSS